MPARPRCQRKTVGTEILFEDKSAAPRRTSESRLYNVAVFLPVSERQFRVGRVLGRGGFEFEDFFGFEYRRLFALYLDEESERQFVEHDLRARDSPDGAPLFVDERGAVAERFEYRGQRGRVRDLRLLLALPLDGCGGRLALFESEQGAPAFASQTQDAAARVEARPRVDDVLLKLRAALRLRAYLFETTTQRLALFVRQPVFFLDLDSHH